MSISPGTAPEKLAAGVLLLSVSAEPGSWEMPVEALEVVVHRGWLGHLSSAP